MSRLSVRTSVTADAPPSVAGVLHPRVAYLVSRFPRLTETFVVAEATAVQRAGANVTLYPLHRERATVVQPDAVALGDQVRYHRILSLAILASVGRALIRRPGSLFGAGWAVLRFNVGSRRLLTGALASFPLAVHLAEHLEADGCDHVHAHFATHPAAAAYVIHRLTGIPFSFTAHGSDLHRDRHMLAEKTKRAAFVVTVSESNRTVILDECGPAVADRVFVVHCGIDSRRFPARPPKEREAGTALKVACLGTLHEVKGQTYLIEACRLLVASGTPTTLTFVGGGPDLAQLQAQVASAGLQDSVTFTGLLTQPEVRTVLEGADVLVTPSVPSADGRREGLPVVLLEAMAVGIPVVASRLSGIPEAVIDGQTGLLVEPGDAVGIADALRRLAADPELAQRLTDAARDLVATSFDVDRSAHQLVGLFGGNPP